jgi:aryl-phospho-beta-D-glucosidase BglC (GH1 family)
VERRLSALRRGVNLSQWFAQTPSSPVRLQTAIVLDDVQRIRRMGFDHVRLPVDPEVLTAGGPADAPDANQLYYLDDAVRLLLDGGLAVIVDLHPADAFKHRLASDSSFVEQTERLWTILARRLAAYDPNRLFLEVLNEPNFTDAAMWGVVQRRLAASVREGAPDHTIIATGHAWSGVEQLEALEPLADPNVAYTFHFYDSLIFTHQGATWTGGPASAVRGVPYPSSPEAVASVIGAAADADARAALALYGQQRWDAPVVNAAIDRVAAWSRKHRVSVLCGEFGVYRTVAPPLDRGRWLRDVRTSLEGHGIGWTVWDYSGDFGVVSGAPGARVIDAEAARALLER